MKNNRIIIIVDMASLARGHLHTEPIENKI